MPVNLSNKILSVRPLYQVCIFNELTREFLISTKTFYQYNKYNIITIQFNLIVAF